MCEEYESYHNKTGRPVVEEKIDPSFVPRVMKTNMPLNGCKVTENELKIYHNKTE